MSFHMLQLSMLAARQMTGRAWLIHLPASRVRHHARCTVRKMKMITPSAALEEGTSAETSLFFEDSRSTFAIRRKPRDKHAIQQCTTSVDTIAAIVTPMGGSHGAVGIIRLSGPLAISITKNIFVPARQHAKHGKPSPPWIPCSHRVEYGTLIDSTGALVDEVLVVPMLAPRSYTREDVIELQCHGGDICLRRVLQLCFQSGARLAQPGEFTLRAFLNGRLDLAQAENVARLVSAYTVSAAEAALSGLQGGLSSLVKSLRTECIEMLAEMDARLDFDDELPELDVNLLIKKIEIMCNRVRQALETEKRGKLLQSGIQVAIVGRPNVGKSSLLNAWSQMERAIVTDVAGTTRDVIETGIVVGGFPVKLLDTAGIRETEDVVESIGVQRSIMAAGAADVIIMVVNAQDGWTYEDTKMINRLKIKMQDKIKKSSILVINKIDQASCAKVKSSTFMTSFSQIVSTSAIHRIGFEDLEAALLNLVEAGEVMPGGQGWTVNERQAAQLFRTNEALGRLKLSIAQNLPIDFWTIDLKEVAMALGEISGDEVSDEVLAQIFSKFCIGK